MMKQTVLLLALAGTLVNASPLMIQTVTEVDSVGDDDTPHMRNMPMSMMRDEDDDYQPLVRVISLDERPPMPMPVNRVVSIELDFEGDTMPDNLMDIFNQGFQAMGEIPDIPPVVLPGDLDIDKILQTFKKLANSDAMTSLSVSSDSAQHDVLFDFGMDTDSMMPHCNGMPLQPGLVEYDVAPPIISHSEEDTTSSLLFGIHPVKMQMHTTRDVDELGMEKVTVLSKIIEVDGKKVQSKVMETVMEYDNVLQTQRLISNRIIGGDSMLDDKTLEAMIQYEKDHANDEFANVRPLDPSDISPMSYKESGKMNFQKWVAHLSFPMIFALTALGGILFALLCILVATIVSHFTKTSAGYEQVSGEKNSEKVDEEHIPVMTKTGNY